MAGYDDGSTSWLVVAVLKTLCPMIISAFIELDHLQLKLEVILFCRVIVLEVNSQGIVFTLLFHLQPYQLQEPIQPIRGVEPLPKPDYIIGVDENSGREKVAQSYTKLLQLISMNYFRFDWVEAAPDPEQISW